MTINVVVTDRVRLPKKAIPLSVVKKRYEIELFDDSACGKCQYRPERDPKNENCEICPAFGGVHRFFSTKELKEDKVLSLPQADLSGIRSYLKSEGIPFKVKDKRVVRPFRHKVKFTGKLFRAGMKDDDGNPRPDQYSAIKQWWKKKCGVIVAPARSGKTVIATYCYSKLRAKTVIIANQKELLNQFYETATGVPAPRYLRGKMVASTNRAGRTGLTNIPDIQERTGKQVIFMPESYGHLVKFIKERKEVPDVLLVTYQSFSRDLARVGAIINKYYSFGIIDEEHGTGADSYLRFASSLDLKYRLGLTATPDRKDARSKLAARVFGPVTSKIDIVTLKPRIVFHAVTTKPKHAHTTWNGAARWLKTSKPRNVEIVKQTFADLREGHNVIIIPVEHKDHMEFLVKLINNQAKINYDKRNEKWPVELAKAFHSKVPDRLAVLNWVDSWDKKGKVHKKLPTDSPRVLVAIRGIIRQGVDMKRPSMLYSIMPMSAKPIVGAPMAYQMFFRVSTPYSKKLRPMVRVFVDQVPMFASCASSVLYHEVLPNSTLKLREKGRYLLMEQDYVAAKKLIAARMSKKSKEVSVRWY